MVTTEIRRDPITGKRMPIKGHLVELRDRIARSVIAMVITTAISFIFTKTLIEILKRPASSVDFQAITPTENIAVYFKVALAGGFIIAMPFLVYQVIAFIAPGLTSKEKKTIFQLLPFVTILFATGVFFAYFVALPPAMGFLGNFMSDLAENVWRLSEYISVVTRMILYVGLVFETPLIIMILARMGLVTPQWLANKRKLWFVLAFVLSALITPTMDPINQSIIAIPLIILLELSILLSKFVYKKRAVKQSEETAENI
ncbi:MAG: twin-arginine translocase subunit TatC [Dehalococcoidales bacterium]|nr:twin-arginine translocase subunit TatC [Dehalococcoidales bacterium]